MMRRRVFRHKDCRADLRPVPMKQRRHGSPEVEVCFSGLIEDRHCYITFSVLEGAQARALTAWLARVAHGTVPGRCTIPVVNDVISCALGQSGALFVSHTRKDGHYRYDDKTGERLDPEALTGTLTRKVATDVWGWMADWINDA